MCSEIIVRVSTRFTFRMKYSSNAYSFPVSSICLSPRLALCVTRSSCKSPTLRIVDFSVVPRRSNDLTRANNSANANGFVK